MSKARNIADIGSHDVIETDADGVTITGGISSNDLTVAGNAIATAGSLSNRNLIINGAMQVSQRGTSFTTVSDTGYQADRFATRNYGGNGTYAVSTLQTDVPTENGFHYSTKYAVDSAATDTGTYGYGIEQRIEGYNMAQLRLGRSDAKQFTLSFWVKSSVAGTYTGAIRTSNGEYSYVFEYTLSANTWTKITKTIPVLTATLSNLDETNGGGLIVSPINLGAQTSKSTASTDTWISGNYVFTSNQVDWMGTAGATCYLTGVQLEVGDTATPFEHRSYGQELALCQRYFWKTSSQQGIWSGQTVNGASYYVNLTHIVPMRATPTIVNNSSSGSNFGAVSWFTLNSQTSQATATATAIGGFFYFGALFNAEL